MTSGFSSRIHGLLEAELRKQLAFAFVIDRNQTRPGSTNLLRGDRVTLKVYALNNSGILLTDVDGTVSPGLAADFFTKTYRIASLRPRHKAHIATIEAEIVGKKGNNFAIDQLGTVSVSAKADLSDFRLRDADRPLVQAKATSRTAAGSMPITRSTQPPNRPSRDTPPPRRSVPLSPVH